jgi:hypothetical protein
VAAFVERVEVQATGRGLNRRRRSPAAFVRGGEAVQNGHHGAFERDRPERAPVIEVRAVAQVEASEERATREGRRRQPMVSTSEAASRSSSATSTRMPSRSERHPPAIPMTVSPSLPEASTTSAGGAPFAAGWAASARAVRPARHAPNARPSAPRRARIATALRVSTTSGAPSNQDLRGTEEADVDAGRTLVGRHGVTVLNQPTVSVTFQ